MSIYRAHVKDIEVILFVINKSNSEAYRKIIPREYFKEPVFTHEELSQKFREMTFFIYELEDESVGVAALQVEGEGLGSVRFVYVLPEHQRKGVGTSLVTYIEAEAGRLGLKTLRVPHVDMNAHWAISFYTKLGYRAVDKRKKPWGYDFFFEKSL
jgi:N-acetylglutamate synthase-like GNAT family acetyltransferase